MRAGGTACGASGTACCQKLQKSSRKPLFINSWWVFRWLSCSFSVNSATIWMRDVVSLVIVEGFTIIWGVALGAMMSLPAFCTSFLSIVRIHLAIAYVRHKFHFILGLIMSYCSKINLRSWIWLCGSPLIMLQVCYSGRYLFRLCVCFSGPSCCGCEIQVVAR